MADTKSLDEDWARIRNAGENLGVRSLFSFADSTLEAGSHVEETITAYEMATEMQDRDPESATYGNFRWYAKNPAPRDMNAVEFCVNVGIVTWIRHRESMVDEAGELLDALLEFSAEGIKRHMVKVTYTNIMLKRAFNAMAVGERLGLPDLADEGYASFSTWYEYTKNHGIHEYLSPTYYGVDLHVLEDIVNWVQNAAAVERARRALNYLWCDIAANWFEPCGRLGGAHSRDYDYIRGDSSRLSQAMFRLFDAPDPGDGVDRGALKALMSEVPRFVHQSWGDEPGQTATQYIGESFTVGSADCSRHNMDKVLTVSVAGTPDTPMFSFLMDGRGDPYGASPVEEPDGHTKSRHLLPFVTSVQRDAEVLLLASAGPHHWDMLSRERPNNDVPNPLQATGLSFDASGKPIRLLSHLTFPLAAAVSIGTTAIDTASTGEFAATGEVVTFELDGTTVGVRVVAALMTDGGTAEVRLVVDQDGLANGVGRITVTHDEAAPNARGTVGIWLRADDAVGVDVLREVMAGEAAAIDGDRVTIVVPGHQGEMRLEADLSTWERLDALGRESATDGAVLWVNGRDLGREILK